jgi:hypothetical protein
MTQFDVLHLPQAGNFYDQCARPLGVSCSCLGESSLTTSEDSFMSKGNPNPPHRRPAQQVFDVEAM